MQMHDPKTNSTRSSSTISGSSSAIRSGYNNSGNNSQVTSSASCKASGGGGGGDGVVVGGSHNSSSSTSSKASDHNHQKRGKKKSARDRQQPNKDEKNASVMSNLSSYSLIDDDHIDDQETINVGNLIIDLESDLEKEKIENEQANNNVLETSSKSGAHSAANAPSSTSQLTTTAPSSSLTSSSSTSSTSAVTTPNKSSTVNKSSTIGQNDQGKSASKSAINQKSGVRKESVSNSATNSSNLSNNGHNVSSRTVFKSSADERGELKMKITRETKPGRNEHKIFASPNHKSPTSSSGGGTGISDRIDNDQEASTYEFGSNSVQGSSGISSTRECGTSTSIGTITEPDCLGPCEPGTSVTLEGIVWQETDGGILVVNVTWRGKTYVGALLDCTRHDWAPPRLCDSPASDIDAKTSKGVRGKRIVTRSNGTGLDEKNLLQTTGKLRNGKGRRIPRPNEPASCNKKQRDTSDKLTGESSSAQIETNAQQADNMASTYSETSGIPVGMDTSTSSTNNAITTSNTNSNSNNNNNNQLESPEETGNNILDKPGPESPALIGCNEPNCNKKYRNMNGLLYHQSHAHSAENESPPNDQDDCSSSSRDKNTKNDENASSEDRLSPHQTGMQSGSPPDPMVCDDMQQPGPNQQRQKRERSPSPEAPQKLSNSFTTDSMHYNMPEHRPRLNESPRITAVRNVNQERRHSSSPSQMSNVPKGSDHGNKLGGANQKHHPYDPQGQSSSMSSGSAPLTPHSSKSSSHSSKQANPQPPLPAPTEEGMKPSGTSTGPPPAPHQANCYFNPAFLAQTFNPYALPPYFPRHMYDSLSTPPNIPTSNAAFLTRFMNNMRVPPPPDSPSRLLSPSMPKNVPFPPFKPDTGAIPPQIPTSHPLPNLSPMTNPQMPPMPVPPLPPLSMANIPPSMRMPNPGDPSLPPSSQPPPFPGLNPMMGLPGMPGNPLRGPLGGPPMPNLVDDPLAKHIPRRF